MFLVLDEFGERHFFLDKRLPLVHYKSWVKACFDALTPAALLAFLLSKGPAEQKRFVCRCCETRRHPMRLSCATSLQSTLAKV
jgi:hypothetical protein